jgi:hypothetical protein
MGCAETSIFFLGFAMSEPHSKPDQHEPDALESIVHSIPVVIPAVGALLIFLLAFIAVFLA